MNIPIPEYCTLERASKLIGCEIGDLLHFGEIGTVTICIKVPSSTKAMVHVFKKMKKPFMILKQNGLLAENTLSL